MCSFSNPNQHACQYNEKKAEELLKLCDPLFKNTPIRGFRYGKVLEGGKFLILCTHKEWTQHYLQNPFKIENGYIRSIRNAIEENYHYYLWPNQTQHNKALEVCYEFDIWNGVTLHRRGKEGVYFWTFTASRNSDQMNNFYINNKSLLENFLKSLTDPLTSLLDQASQKACAQFQEPFDISPLDSSLSASESLKMLENTFNPSSFINSPLTEFHFSKREYESLFLLSQGLTIKEIAHSLGLSPRTIEFYLNNIRDKTGCRNRVKLVKLFETHSLQKSMTF